MTVNIWGQVGVVTGFLPLTALTGTAGQLLGMTAAATAAEWKAVTFNTATSQLAVPAGTVAAPPYTFAGALGVGPYLESVTSYAISVGGVRRARFTTTGNVLAFNIPAQMVLGVLQEDMSGDIVAAATTDLATASGNFARITNAAGATLISSFGGDTIPAGTCFELQFVITGGSVTLVYDANKIDISTGTNTVLQTGDIIRLRKTNDASPFYKLVGFQRGLSTTGITAKGDLIVGTVSGGGIVPGIQAAGSAGQAIVSDPTQNSGLIYVDNPGRPVLNVNPNWLFDQVNEGALYTVNALTVRGPDGWTGDAVGAGIFKLRTVVDPDNAALKALEITCTTVDAAIAAADKYSIFTAIEGYDASSLMIGTASAQSITVQFKYKSSLVGTYGVAIQNSAINRRYIGTIVVPDALEHEYTLILTLDTAGVWLYTNGVGLYFILTLAAGTNFQAVAGAWAAGAEQTTAAQANFMSNVANIAYLKRFQIIPGNVVQPYRAADVHKDLLKCQRYDEKSYNQGVAVGTSSTLGLIYSANANFVTTGFGAGTASFKVVKRDIPTMSLFSRAGTINLVSDGNQADYGAGTFNFIGTNAATVQNTSGANYNPAGGMITYHYRANSRLS